MRPKISWSTSIFWSINRDWSVLCEQMSRIENQKEKMGYTNTWFPGHWLQRSRHEARLQLRIFSYESITSQNHKIALNVILSWKVENSLIEIQQADIIILVLTFLFQLALRDNISTNEIHVCCIKIIWFCLVEFNSIYSLNRMGYSHRARSIDSEKSDLFMSHQSRPVRIRDFHGWIR